MLRAGRLCLFSFLIHHEDPNPLRWKYFGQTCQRYDISNQRAYLDDSHLGFHRGSYVNKTVTHGCSICGALSSFSLNVQHRWVLELVLFHFQISLTPDWEQAPNRAEESTSWSWLLDQNLGTKYATFTARLQSRLIGYIAENYQSRYTCLTVINSLFKKNDLLMLASYLCLSWNRNFARGSPAEMK